MISLFRAAPAAAGQDPGAEAAKSWNIMESGVGRGSLVFIFFLLIIAVLRFLYGPRGKLRDPRWDELNAISRREDAELKKMRETAARLNYREKKLKAWSGWLEREGEILDAYVGAFALAPESQAMFGLKLEHSRKVLENAWTIALYEDVFWDPSGGGAGEEQARVLLLAALYHDIGRFEQFYRFHTFRDAESVNHARFGSRLLLEERFISGETRRTRSQVRLAVLMHNLPSLPPGLDRGMLPACLALRDADKLDILRIMAANLAAGRKPDPSVVLELPDVPSYSPELLEKVVSGEDIFYAELRCVNDFRLFLAGWPARLAFEASRRLLSQSGHIQAIISGLPLEVRRKFPGMGRAASDDAHPVS